MRFFSRFLALLALLVASQLVSIDRPSAAPGTKQPSIIVITIDTLRADRISAYGYERQTSPQIDALINGGTRFAMARTVEPLTNPALTSFVTSQYPHQHGGSRNGIRMRQGIASLPKALQANGYRTAAFVGNWTLRDRISGLAEHFEEYEEVLTRGRWFGIVRREATAEDLTESSLKWLAEHRRMRGDEPYFLWVHYVEPHAPYRAHKEFLKQLKIEQRSGLSASDRYDTEIAYVDRSVGELMSGIDELGLNKNLITVVTADHGESLGEHDYWGHGRHLYEASLHIPMAINWPGKVQPAVVKDDALLIDVAPTLLGLARLEIPTDFEGQDWSSTLRGGQEPAERITYYQAHRGAVMSRHDSDLARRSGLLEVGVIRQDQKEIFKIRANKRLSFDLSQDPGELASRVALKSDPSEGLQEWMRVVYDGLGSFDDMPPEPLDPEAAEKLKSLGYID